LVFNEFEQLVSMIPIEKHSLFSSNLLFQMDFILVKAGLFGLAFLVPKMLEPFIMPLKNENLQLDLKIVYSGQIKHFYILVGLFLNFCSVTLLLILV